MACNVADASLYPSQDATCTDDCNWDLSACEYCGDATVQGDAGEQCDDGNSVPDDGCGNECRWNCVSNGDCDDNVTCTVNRCIDHACNFELEVDGDGDGASSCPGPGQDCCDSDKAVFPGQTQFFTAANECGGMDYDCSDELEQEYPDLVECILINPAIPSQNLPAECDAAAGWRNSPVPDCGVVEKYSTTCEAPGLTNDCVPVDTIERQQACH